MIKKKMFAPFIMLLAGTITLALTLHWGYTLVDILWVLLIVMLVFYILGSIIQGRILKFEELNEEAERERLEQEGSVIEKDVEDEKDTSDGEEYVLPPLTGAMPQQFHEEETQDMNSEGEENYGEESGGE